MRAGILLSKLGFRDVNVHQVAFGRSPGKIRLMIPLLIITDSQDHKYLYIIIVFTHQKILY